jgi:hypothetical protein
LESNDRHTYFWSKINTKNSQNILATSVIVKKTAVEKISLGESSPNLVTLSGVREFLNFLYKYYVFSKRNYFTRIKNVETIK